MLANAAHLKSELKAGAFPLTGSYAENEFQHAACVSVKNMTLEPVDSHLSLFFSTENSSTRAHHWGDHLRLHMCSEIGQQNRLNKQNYIN